MEVLERYGERKWGDGGDWKELGKNRSHFFDKDATMREGLLMKRDCDCGS